MTSKKTKGFTIVELLTVMSIIIILMSILMPGLSRTRRYARVVVQRSQFSDISKGLELYRNDHQETYPDSGAVDTNATPVGYCGAMKLCEALVGQDGMGFNPASTFQANTSAYLFNLCANNQVSSVTVNGTPSLMANLQARTPYLASDSIKAAHLEDLYATYTGVKNYYIPQAPFGQTVDATPPAVTQFPNSVLTDVFLQNSPRICGGKKLGMPVLYYKANTTNLVHDPCYMEDYGNVTTNPSIYNFDDNYALTGLGSPWQNTQTPATAQPMFTNPDLFYKAITNTKITSTPRPHNEDTYILLSAGWDGLYGTADDIYNFSD